MKRRDVLKTMAVAGLAAGAVGKVATAQNAAQTFVLVHGAWHGGWCWSRVADRLRGAGHQVFTPTQTGLGERKHLLSKDITLDTFTKDIVNVIEAEEMGCHIITAPADILNKLHALGTKSAADLSLDAVKALREDALAAGLSLAVAVRTA